MYYHTNGANYSGCHGTSGSPYPYGWFRPQQPKPHRWEMPTVKNPGATTKTKNEWIQPDKKGVSI